MSYKFLIGADPEFFVQRRRHFISAHPYPCGTKAKPMKTQHGHIQVDGIAMECNVNPAATEDEFLTNLRGVMADMTSELHKYEPEAVLVSKPSIFVGNVKLGQMPVYASRLGCEPDYNAWTEDENPTPNARSPLRTASGHIHVGWTKDANIYKRDHFEQCVRVVKQLDYYLGLPSLLWDDDNRRRTLYGKAGAFRPKPYGVEYRVLSNAWTSTDKLVRWVFKATHTAVDQLFNHGNFLPKSMGDLARHCIDTNDTVWHKNNPAVAEEVLR